MLKKAGVLFILLAWVIMLPSCEKKTSTPNAPAGSVQKKASGPVLANVDGEVITVDDFEAELDALPEFTRKQLTSKEQKQKRLDKMIEEILLQKEAQRRALDQDEEIQRKVDRYQKRLITEKLYREIAKERAAIDDAEVQRYYDEHKDQFTQKERIRASQILILVPPNAGPEREKEAETKAEEALTKAKAGGDFSELAKQYSEGPTATRGGDLGYFSRGRMIPEFEEIAFSLENVGDISDVIKTKFGYHIIQLKDKQAKKTMAIDEVRDRIVRQLESKKRREIRQSLGKDLRGKALVEIHEAYLEEEGAEKGNEEADKQDG